MNGNNHMGLVLKRRIALSVLLLQTLLAAPGDSHAQTGGKV